MTLRLAAALLALAVAGGAARADSGVVSARVVANPLSVSLAVAPDRLAVGTTTTATAAVRNLGSNALGVEVTLRIDPAGATIAGGATRTVSVAKAGTATVSWPVCVLEPGRYFLLASARAGAFTADSPARLLTIDAGSGACPEDAAAVVAPGGTLSTDGEGDGARAADPVETAVTTPDGGRVSIVEGTASPAATAFTFLRYQVQIEAPPAEGTRPLAIVFLVDASIVTGPLEVFRNAAQLPACPGDPCLVGRTTLVDGDVELVVRTSAASAWTFGVPRAERGLAAGTLTTSNGVKAGFAAGSDGKAVGGSLAYGSFSAKSVVAFARAGRSAWFAGLGADGRTYLVYVEDNGPNGHGDRFRLWIAGAEQTTNGRLRSGDVRVAQ